MQPPTVVARVGAPPQHFRPNVSASGFLCLAPLHGAAKAEHLGEMSRAPLSRRPPAERIVWQGAPVAQRASMTERVAAIALSCVALVALGFAVVVVRALGQTPTPLLLVSLLCASGALLIWRVPPAWRGALRYEITEHHVITRRGPLRRIMDRQSLSYTRIRWHEQRDDVGDLVLVRAVPTGAMWRTLSLTLSNLESPDRVLAILRGVEASPSMGKGSVPLPQRLDADERVLWTARPLATRWHRRRLVTLSIALMLVLTVARAAVHLAQLVASVHHALAGAVFVVFVVSLSLAWMLVLGTGLGMAYVAVVQPARRLRETRYFVTNQRVLIRRGLEELSLDRSRIAYVIAGDRRGSKDLFLVLDGPRARAMAVHGAFGAVDEPAELSPVFAAIPAVDGPESLLSALPSRA